MRDSAPPIDLVPDCDGNGLVVTVEYQFAEGVPPLCIRLVSSTPATPGSFHANLTVTGPSSAPWGMRVKSPVEEKFRPLLSSLAVMEQVTQTLVELAPYPCAHCQALVFPDGQSYPSCLACHDGEV